MACILMPQCSFTNGHFRCILPEETIEEEVKVKTMKGIHMFRRDHTTQMISCKLWDPRLHPYPLLPRKMQPYLDLEGNNSSQLCANSYQVDKTTSLQKTSVPKRAANKKKRTKTLIKRQFIVRLVEKPLLINIEPEAVATTATAKQTSMVQRTATAAKQNSIPLTVCNLSSPKVQEMPNPTMKKSLEREGMFTPNCGSPLMEQQQPKPTATATFATPLTRDDTPWPNTVPASTNVFVARSWPFPPNGNEV